MNPSWWKCFPLCALMLVPGFEAVSSAAETPTNRPSFAVTTVRGFPGTTVPLPVEARRATNIVAAQFDLAYSSERAAFGPLSLTAENSGHVIQSREISPGVRRVIVYSTRNSLLRTNGFKAAMPVTIPVTERNSSGPVIPQQVIFSRADGTRFGGLTNSTGTVFVVPVFFNADGSAQFFLPSEADTTYVVQATTNLVDWVNLSTNIATASFIDLVDVDAKDYPHRFYRAIALENLTGNQIGTLGLNATGEFTFEYRGEAGRQYVLETSTNLSNWFSVLTNSSTGSPLVYTNLVPDASSHGFFRLRRLPRP